MGKAGNKARREAKKVKEQQRHASLDGAIQEALAQDAQEEIEFAEWRKEFLEKQPTPEEYETSFSKIYGQPGPPQDNVFPILDHLGRTARERKARGLPAQTSVIHLPASNDVSKKTLTIPNDQRRVTILRDHMLDIPEIWWEIYVETDPAEPKDAARFAQMFARARCTRAETPERADLVVFSGGSDVDPALYGETSIHPRTRFDVNRDSRDIELYNKCLSEGIAMFGVCRGAQFLHVMNGGKLYQDVDGHYGDHKIWDIEDRNWIEKTSSVHHQMCAKNTDGGMRILATNGSACKRRSKNANPKDDIIGPKADVEAFFYPDTMCLGVQGHPEYANYPYYTTWCLKQINELIVCNPAIESRDGTRRVKRELLIERGFMLEAKQETE